MSQDGKLVEEHYDAQAERYHEQYQRENLFDTNLKYPSNYFRLQLLLNSFITNNIKRVIEVGVGEGTPLATLARADIDVWGFDISQGMVDRSKEKVASLGIDPDHVFWADIQDPTTYVHALREGRFDGLMAMGVMPHVSNDNVALENMSTLVRPGGKVFIEFRNKLFSLFSFNRNTVDFILDDLLANVGSTIKDTVRKDLESRLRVDMPPIRKTFGDENAPGYDVIPSKFHNPFEVVELFERQGFTDVKLLWYHYHPSMPYLSATMPELFRKEAVNLEHESSGWRGYFLCSAFVVEATNCG